jgi:drug/metabolite transporter (DMT)-like permease
MTSPSRRIGGRLYDAPYVLLVLCMLFWAGNAVLGRYVAGHVPPVALSIIRWSGAALVLIGFALPYLRADWKTIRAHAGLMTILSLAGISTYNALTYYGLQFTEAINAILLQSVGPLLIAAWTFVLFGERLTPRQLLGLLLSFAGVVVIVARGEVAALLAFHFNPGDLYLLIAVLAYALYSALLKRSPAIHPLSFVTLTMGWGAILLTPVFALEIAYGQTLIFDLKTVLALAYVILFPSLLSHFFFYRGVELIGPNRAAPFFYLVPVFGSALAITLLGERLYLFHGLGYVLIIAGIWIATRERPVEQSAGSIRT